MITAKQLQPQEIALLRETLKLSDAEFASRIGLSDRRYVKLLESGAEKPSDDVAKALLKLLQRSAGRSAKLKKMLAAIKSRTADM
jgi:DNA-binding transcriptional regulator YiaG